MSNAAAMATIQVLEDMLTKLGEKPTMDHPREGKRSRSRRQEGNQAISISRHERSYTREETPYRSLSWSSEGSPRPPPPLRGQSKGTSTSTVRFHHW
ncbi:hypothetical protein M5689_024750 [Euphorbia peplus]|nr:hypothetical protein M5689_024750 [Euphorbia peplus]